jgi:hypothetical protein
MKREKVNHEVMAKQCDHNSTQGLQICGKNVQKQTQHTLALEALTFFMT